MGVQAGDRHRARSRGHERDDGVGANDVYSVRMARVSITPAQVPSVVLAESLTGDHRRDFHANRLLRACQVRDVTESHAREAARLRAATGRPATITATDAVVAAFASTCPSPIVLTSDPGDLAALAEHTGRPITIARG